MPRSTRTLGLAILICLLVLALGAGDVAAQLKPSKYTKTVCDWAFVSGPRDGQSGKESRNFFGPFPNLQGVTYWAGGASSTSIYRFQSPSPLWDPPGTRWYVTVELPDREIVANLQVREARFPFVTTRRLTFFPVSNGAHVDCLELNGAAVSWIRGTYGREGNCDCAHDFDFVSTVACVESCAAYWSDGAKWINRPAPGCLGDPSIVVKSACLLSNRWWDRPGPGGDAGSDPGGSVGDPCGPLDPCKPGLVCDRGRCTRIIGG